MTHEERIALLNQQVEDMDPIGWGHPLMLTALGVLAALIAVVVLLVRAAIAH